MEAWLPPGHGAESLWWAAGQEHVEKWVYTMLRNIERGINEWEFGADFPNFSELEESPQFWCWHFKNVIKNKGWRLRVGNRQWKDFQILSEMSPRDTVFGPFSSSKEDQEVTWLYSVRTITGEKYQVLKGSLICREQQSPNGCKWEADTCKWARRLASVMMGLISHWDKLWSFSENIVSAFIAPPAFVKYHSCLL